MGVCIFYKGRLRRPEDIDPITDELADICRSAEWEYNLANLKSEYGVPLRGITFNIAPNRGGVSMLFREDGTLADFFDDGKEEMPLQFTKTQFAGIDAHMTLCRLLQYLSKRWFETLEVDDEGGYYETMDSEALQSQIDIIDRGIQAITDRLNSSSLGND